MQSFDTEPHPGGEEIAYAQIGHSPRQWHRCRDMHPQAASAEKVLHDGRTLLYRASKRDCDVCPLKARCCTRGAARKIPRDVHEDARDVARRKMKTKAFARSRDERKRVEMRFAHLKTHHGFERLRLRGLSGARDEFHLAAIVQNLKTMALRMVWPPPDLAAASVA